LTLRRLERNREAARQSRRRKKELLENLGEKVRGMSAHVVEWCGGLTCPLPSSTTRPQVAQLNEELRVLRRAHVEGAAGGIRRARDEQVRLLQRRLEMARLAEVRPRHGRTGA
jgi:hypothetical protein